MLYVDVTAACLLPLQSGIPRTTRGIYRLLAENEPEKIAPIFWQPFRHSYTKLSSRSQSLLDDPFSAATSSHTTPRDSTGPLLWASFSDLLGKWPPAVPLAKLLGAKDTLFLTSLFPDNRLEYLLRLASRPGRKIALFHDAIPLRDPNVGDLEKTRHVKTLRLLSRMDRVIAVSHAAEKDLLEVWQRHDLAPAPTCVIPWPVPFTEVRPEFSEPAWEQKKILYVSRLKQIKNHAALFTACEKLWSNGIDFKLELIGCEDIPLESHRIVQEVMRLRSKDRPVVWRGHVTEEELHTAYRTSTFTAFPSLAEGFGLPIIESFWHGRPVICGDEAPMSELARDGGSVITDVRNVETLAAALQGLLQNREKCVTLAREAYARPIRSWSDYWQELKPVLLA